MTNILIELVDGTWPTCKLSKDKNISAHVKVDKEQLKLWKANIKAYQQTQKEMLDLVNHYEPLRYEKARTARIQGLVKKAKAKQSTE